MMNENNAILSPVLWLTLKTDFFETLRSRWYQIYLLSFVLIIGLFFQMGLSDSQIMGFMGLSRLLLTFIQVNIIILPIFVLVTTVRTLVSDRETGVWEYVLSLPISLRDYYWGKAWGRLFAMLLPLLMMIILVSLWGLASGASVPITKIAYMLLLLSSNVACFLGIALLISVVASTQEMAIGIAFSVWLMAEAFIDILLLGLLSREQVSASWIIGVALLNPLQGFRMAGIALFDPDLSSLGAVAYKITDSIGRNGLMAWAIIWPVVFGTLCAWIGFRAWQRRDLVG